METKAADNKLLKISAILLIVCAVLGIVAMVITSGQVISPELITDPAVLSSAAQKIGVSPDEMLTLMSTEEGVAQVGILLSAMRLSMIAMAAVAALPRLIGGLLGISRSKKPEKNGFFLIWGVVLLVLGVIGLVFSGGLASFGGIVSLVGGVALPICYIVGASQQKKLHIASVSEQAAATAVAGPPADSSEA